MGPHLILKVVKRLLTLWGLQGVNHENKLVICRLDQLAEMEECHRFYQKEARNYKIKPHIQGK